MRESGVLVLRNDQRMLGVLLHAPRDPIYSPKAARSCWNPTRKAILAFCRVAHRTATVACPVRISFHSWRSRPLDLRAGWRTGHCPVHTGHCRVHTGQSGAHRTVRCPQPTVGWGHASRADLVADRCAGGRTVR
jgi:hypothetical protein